MKTKPERLARMHQRARELQLRRDRQALHAWGGASLGLVLCLLGLAVVFPGGHGLTGEVSAGASLLSDSAGGYVLVAVLSFAAAVGITVLCFRYRRKREEQNSEKTFHPSKEETP